MHRSPEGLEVTAAGRQWMQVAQTMEAQLQTAHQKHQGDPSAVSGPARLWAPECIASELLAPHLHRLCDQAPQLSLTLLSDHLEPRSLEGVDMMLSLNKPRDPDWLARRVATVRFGLYAAESYLQTFGFIPRPRQSLAGHRVLAYDSAHDHTPEMSWLHLRAQESHVALRAPSLRSLRESIMWGVGVGVLPTFMATSGLKSLVGPQHLPRRGLWLALHKDKQHLGQVRATARFLVDTLSTLLDPAP
jgi:DNA-binding transcriptional LysR family regulator